MNKKPTVLVVDDSQTSRNHLVRILEDDYVVLEAIGGVEAIQIAKSVLPDIILLDIVMPQMDGYEVLSHIREERETKYIPVIFITSLDHEGGEEKGLSLGANDYITKPYNPTITKLRVQVVLKITEQIRTINELSMADIVTKLPNRWYFEKRLSEEWERAAAEKRALGILMVAVDNLRQYNSSYGYKSGDELLVKVAKIVKVGGIVSPGDIAARWEYPRFVLLLQNSTAADANTIAEKIRSAVSSANLKGPDGKDAEITISVGVNSAVPGVGDSTEQDFIKNADSALYLAHELGRNRVVVNS